MSHKALVWATDAPLPPLAQPGFAVPLVPGVASSHLAALGSVIDVGWQWGLQDRRKPGRLVLLSYGISSPLRGGCGDGRSTQVGVYQGMQGLHFQPTGGCPGSRFPLSCVSGFHQPWLSSVLWSCGHHLLSGVGPWLFRAGLCGEALGARSSQMDGKAPPVLSVQDGEEKHYS